MLPLRPRGKKPETIAMTSLGVLMKARLLASAGTMLVICMADERRVSTGLNLGAGPTVVDSSSKQCQSTQIRRAARCREQVRSYPWSGSLCAEQPQHG